MASTVGNVAFFALRSQTIPLAVFGLIGVCVLAIAYKVAEWGLTYFASDATSHDLLSRFSAPRHFTTGYPSPSVGRDLLGRSPPHFAGSCMSTRPAAPHAAAISAPTFKYPPEPTTGPRVPLAGPYALGPHPLDPPPLLSGARCSFQQGPTPHLPVRPPSGFNTAPSLFDTVVPLRGVPEALPYRNPSGSVPLAGIPPRVPLAGLPSPSHPPAGDVEQSFWSWS